MYLALRANSELLRASSSRASRDADVILRCITPAPRRRPPVDSVTPTARRMAVLEWATRLAELGRHQHPRSRERSLKKSLSKRPSPRGGKRENGLGRAQVADAVAHHVDRARRTSVVAVLAPQQSALPAGEPQAAKRCMGDVEEARALFLWSSWAWAAQPRVVSAWRSARGSGAARIVGLKPLGC